MKGKQERIRIETIERLKRYEHSRQRANENYQRKSINEIIEDILTEIGF